MGAPRFEAVRTAAGWHGRLVAANGRTVWTTEVYTRRRAAVAAINVLLAAVETHLRDPVEVRDIDERPPPPAPLTAEPPYYLGRNFMGDNFWHDHDYHWRNCYESDCSEETPPVGARVLVRFGAIDYREKP